MYIVTTTLFQHQAYLAAHTNAPIACQRKHAIIYSHRAAACIAAIRASDTFKVKFHAARWQ